MSQGRQFEANILLVDDKPENLLALVNLLKSPDLKLVKAGSGNEALARLLEMPFACILLDVHMPEMDGLEVAQIIRRDEATKHLPIIFMTAHHREDREIFRGYEAGAVDYLFKPLVPEIVRSKVSVFAELYRRQQTIHAQAMELERVNREVRSANVELERFAYIASHDLQEPLRTVSNYVTLLERRYKGKLDDDANDYIHFAVDGAKRMQALIKAVLDLSRAGTKPRNLEAVDCHILVKNILEALELTLEETSAKVTCGGLPVVEADPVLIGQLFQNLISNAIKYRRPNIPPKVQISAEKKGAEWTFCIEDNGIGFEMSFAELVFEPFKRLHGHDVSGTGIGLATCRKIVQRHGGRIWAHSVPGKGSTFRFTLPA